MIPPSATTYAGPVGFEMELDEPTTIDNEEDGDEETTVDEVEAYEESSSEELDTTIDYSYLRGAVESPHGLEAYPGTSKFVHCAEEPRKHISVPTFFARAFTDPREHLLALSFEQLVGFGRLCPLFRFLEALRSGQRGWSQYCAG